MLNKNQKNLSYIQTPINTDYASISPTLERTIDLFKKRETLHAYLISGLKGIGKNTYSKVLACAYFCTSISKPCLKCQYCKQVLDGTLPGLHQIIQTDGKKIGVEQVRELIDLLAQHALYVTKHVVLIEPIEQLTSAAQNALLKTLEESSNVIFLLMTHERNSILSTIASRCIAIRFPPWSDETIKQTLQLYGYENASILQATLYSRGNIAQALAYFRTNDRIKEATDIAMQVLNINSAKEWVSLSVSLKDKKDDIDRYFDAIEHAFYYLLLVNTGQLPKDVLEQYPVFWQEQVSKLTFTQINKLLRYVMNAKKQRHYQVNWQSIADRLFFQIWEEKRKWQL